MIYETKSLGNTQPPVAIETRVKYSFTIMIYSLYHVNDINVYLVEGGVGVGGEVTDQRTHVLTFLVQVFLLHKHSKL